MLLAFLLACDPKEPVLSGLAPPLEADGEVQPEPYSKGEGVYVDVQYLAGKGWDEARDEVSVQMGDIVSIEELDPRDGREIRLERGFLRTKEGRIYVVYVDLPRPMRRTAALSATGLPPHADDWHAFTHEYRLRWHSGFDRIRMGRIEGDSQMVAWVEALRFNPRSALQQ